MTLKQFLELSPPEQAIEVAKARQKKPWKHGLDGDTSFDKVVSCPKCNQVMFDCRDTKTLEWWTEESKAECSIPDPIDIKDRNAADAYRKICKRAKYSKAIYEVFRVGTINHSFESWLIHDRTVSDDFAACMASEGYFDKETEK